MTSNLGALAAQTQSGPLEDDAQDAANQHSIMMQAVRHHFPPEFINRLDDIVIFNRYLHPPPSPALLYTLRLSAALLCTLRLLCSTLTQCSVCSLSVCSLRLQDMPSIVDIQIRGVQKLVADRRITVDVQDKAKNWLGTNPPPLSAFVWMVVCVCVVCVCENELCGLCLCL